MLIVFTAVVFLAAWYRLSYILSDFWDCVSLFVAAYFVYRLFYVYNNKLFYWSSGVVPEKQAPRMRPQKVQTAGIVEIVDDGDDLSRYSN